MSRDAVGEATTSAPADRGGRRRTPSITEQTLVVCALIGATQMTWGTIVPALPLYVDHFGASALVLGPIIAAFGLGRALVNIPAGLVLLWWRPRPFLYTVTILLIAVTALTGLCTDSASLIAARVVAGVLGGAAITIGFAVLVSGAPPDRRGRVMATATAVQMSAGALGAFLGGAALSVLPLAGVFVVAAAPVALALLWDSVRPATLYWAASSAPGQSVPSAEPVRSDAPARPAGSLRPLIAALALGSFAAFFARFGGEQGLIPVLAYDGGGLSPFTLGLALAAATLVSLAAMPVIGRVIDRGPRLGVLAPSVLAAACTMLLFPLADGPWVYALVIVGYGLANSISSVVPSVVMSDAFPSRSSGLVVGVTRTAGDAGAVVGPLAALAVYDVIGAEAAVGLIAGVVVLANVPLMILLRTRAGGRPNT
ncbi:MFS transporter [Agreia sp. PsM10]|uniref:MFS transporter n=1 Tax=Agreia sp. PsM10 TaxID=3030533 RepID=UPI00263AC970|nr:MFS transporter [Agreia sp. PsM10]MDN4641943.1 MFS transporter [Agreia sp. PsM10]